MKKRIWLIWLNALLVLFMCVCPGFAEEQTAQPLPTVKVCIVVYPGYAYQNAQGVWMGIDVEYLENIAQRAGLNIEFVDINDRSIEDYMQMLKDGKVQIIVDMAKTPEREKDFLFSENEMGKSASGVFVRKDNDRIDFGNVDQMKALTYGFPAGLTSAAFFKEWCQSHGFTPIMREYNSIPDVQAALERGEVDAMVFGSDFREGYKTILTFSSTPYYLIFNKENIQLKNKVDTAMGEILRQNPLYENELLQKYNVLNQERIPAYSKAEKEYIAQHGTAKVAVLQNDRPFYTRTAVKEQGILPDLYQEISQQTGLQFTFVPYKTEALAEEAVRSGEADVLGLYSGRTTSAYAAGLQLTRPYTDVSVVIVLRSGTSASQVKTAAVHQRTLDTLQQSQISDLKISLKGYETISACYEALEHREADAIICGLPAATWVINQTNSALYYISPLSTSINLDLCGALANSSLTLRSILDKGIFGAQYAVSGIFANDVLPENNLISYLERIPPAWSVGITFGLLVLILWLVLTLISNIRHQKEKDAIAAQKAENERRESELAALEKANDAKNRFFSNISHDMRTPLNAIIGFSRLSDQETDLSKIRSYNAKIESSGELLLELINDTLTISKSESGKLKLNPEPIYSAKAGAAILTPIQTIADQKKIQLIIDKSGYRPRMILADQLNLEKIFLNLLNNAVKFTPEGGHIWLTLKDLPPNGDFQDTIFIIRDDGIGISKEFLPHIFDPFSQEQRHGYESMGTGLGLSIVKQLVDLMGGSIEVQSEKNKGTTFTVRLPFQEVKDAPLPAPEKEITVSADLTGKKILLCEDNALNAELATALLSSKGLQIVRAANGQEGVRLFNESQRDEFAAILMDLRMPVMDGFDATRCIRALERADAHTIPIIAMTADAFDEDVKKCLAAGMNDHIAKPIDPAKLFSTLERFEKTVKSEK